MAPDYIERLKKIKSDRKITTETLASDTGIPVSTLSKIFAGTSDSVKLSNLVAICEVLNVSLDFIVSGIPENTNNFTLNADEIRLVDGYRRLDSFGRDFVHTVIEKETERIARDPSGRGFTRTPSQAHSFSPSARSDADIGNLSSDERSGIIIGGLSSRFGDTDAIRRNKIDIPYFDLAISAGTGEYLESSTAESIKIPDTELGRRADFAVRINGNSMEPKFHTGDILLCESCESVNEGELGVFVLDDSGYFKKFGGDRLISLNPDYGPILLKDYTNSFCKGRVIGKLKRK